MKEILKAIEDMTFRDFKEAYKDRYLLKSIYSSKEKDVQKVYKWYFYHQLCMLKPHYKDSLWLWLNNEINDGELEQIYQQFVNITNHQHNLCKFDKKNKL